MTKLCPRCQLPAGPIGHAIAATSSDGERHGVIGICKRCTGGLARLPKKFRMRGFHSAVDRALDDPARYTVKLMPDHELAELAVAMLGHTKHAQETLRAMEWNG